jgi:hypothetical protein
MRTHARRGALLGCVLFVVLGAAPADAATLRVVTSFPHQYLVYDAAAGEKNDVTVTDDGQNLTITDRGVLAILPATSDTSTVGACTFVLNTAICPRYVWVTFNLGDGDDRFATGDRPDPFTAQPTVYGGPGNDSATGSMEFHGGSGDDDLTLGGGQRGGYFVYDPGEPGDVHVTIDGVADDGHAGEHDNVRPGVNLWIRSPGAPVIEGSDGPDTVDVADNVTGGALVDGRGGDDRLSAFGGPDRLIGGPGDDLLSVGPNALSVECDDGVDEVRADPAILVDPEACETVR